MLADLSIQEGKRLYCLRPKIHFFHHCLYDVDKQLRSNCQWVVNPNLWGCEMNEDYIGRISRMSRRVSPKIATQRTIDRYLVAAKLLFKKFQV